MPGDEASDDAELGNLLWVLVENKDGAGDAGYEEVVD
jgi:hypothetical protein